MAASTIRVYVRHWGRVPSNDCVWHRHASNGLPRTVHGTALNTARKAPNGVTGESRRVFLTDSRVGARLVSRLKMFVLTTLTICRILVRMRLRRDVTAVFRDYP